MENEVIKAIRNRRSTRKYKDKQISEEELQTLLDAGIQAPSANNSQSWHFTVIQDRDMINFISDKSKEVMLKSDNENIVNIGKNAVNIFYNAPTLIVVSGKKDVSSYMVDCSAAIENMLIAAESISLGTVWVGLSRFFFTLSDEVKKLKLPDGYEPFYTVAVGYKENDSVLGPTKIFFGRNKIEVLAEQVKNYGSNVLLVYGGGSIKRNGIYEKITDIFNKNNISFWELPGVEPNPRISSVRKGIEICRENKIDILYP